jgi:8-oxo-dGTP diphosphatase
MNNIILEITDKDIDPSFAPTGTTNFKTRDSSRGILIHQRKLGLLNVTKSGYYKLPGGGFEKDEDLDQAFKRELIEETGCDAEILDRAGVIIETRSKLELVQTSYVFLAKVVGIPQEPQFDEGEIGAGYQLEWIEPHEAERIFNTQRATDYEGKFICVRDRTIFKYYSKQIFSLTSK